MNEIKCPHDLNQFLLREPIFENPFPEEECKQRRFYGDCFHCFATAIASRDHQLKNAINKIRAEIEDTLYVDSLIFTELIDFQNGKISADDVIEEFNRVTRLEVLRIINKYKAEGEEK